MTTMPAVSIILPTYNRARFLPLALRSIRTQLFTDWELIIVDDGSTDETPALVPELTAEMVQPVKLIRQDNRGAYGARNTGLDNASGEFVAFFDSDDEWLPHHLAECVQALRMNSEVDWVYAACRMLDDETGRVISQSTFFDQQKPRPFMRLSFRQVGALRILDQRDLAALILEGNGLFAGLQNSVIRSRVFEEMRFEAVLRNEAEDQIFVILAALQGRRFAYLNDVHVVYRVHAQNSSGASMGMSAERRRTLYETVARGFEQLPQRARLNARERRALDRLAANYYFWNLGYACLWENGRYQESFQAFRKALKLQPTRLEFWKTFFICKLKSYLPLVRPVQQNDLP